MNKFRTWIALYDDKKLVEEFRLYRDLQSKSVKDTIWCDLLEAEYLKRELSWRYIEV